MTNDPKLVERVAMALCADRHGPLEDGSWAKLNEASRNYFRKAATAALSVMGNEAELLTLLAEARQFIEYYPTADAQDQDGKNLMLQQIDAALSKGNGDG